LAEAEAIHIDPGFNFLIQCALACTCYHLLNFITAEWYDLVPELLGHLGPIIYDLPPGLSLSERYHSLVAEPSSHSTTPSPATLPLIPFPLFKVFKLQAVLRETLFIPSQCAEAVQTNVREVALACEHYQCSYTASPFTCNAAHHGFLAAYILLNMTTIDTKFNLIECQANWDHIIHLLHSDWLFANFTFDTPNFEELHMI
jgi:hypothetical protein